MGVDHELQCLVVALLVGHVGLEGLDHPGGARKVLGEASGQKVTNWQLQVTESQAAAEGGICALLQDSLRNLGGCPGAFAGEDGDVRTRGAHQMTVRVR